MVLLILVEGVSYGHADDYIISGASEITKNNHNWQAEDSDNLLTEIEDGIYTLVVETGDLTKDTNYGFKVKKNSSSWDGAFPESDYKISVPESGNYTLIYYVDISNKMIRVIALPLLRANLYDNWSEIRNSSHNFELKEGFTFTYEISANVFTGDTSFRIFSPVFSKLAYPGGQDEVLTYGGDIISSAYFNKPDATDWSWKLKKPSYDFDKVVITAVYKPFDTTNSADFGQWDVKADAYISKSISAVGVATFGSEADVNFEGVAGLTAKKGKVGADGKITWTSATTLKGGEGAFLEGEEGFYSIPVAASASADIEHNDFVAITTETQLAQSTTDGYTNFILTKVDDVLGFYKVNTAGSWCAAGSAYLKVANTIVGEAREFIPIVDEETTGIGDLKNSSDEEWKSSPMYNLAGQKVGKDYKGIVIVNGKKFINK